MPSAAAWVVACTAPMPPNAHEVEAARVGAGEREHAADRVGHVRVDERDDGDRGVLGVEPELARPSRSSAACAPSASSAQPSAPEAGRVEAPEHEVGVGDGRLGAAAAVADRVRARSPPTRARRAACLPSTRAIEPPPAPIGVDVDHRERDAVAVAPVPVALELGAAVADEAHVVARAAHVDADDVAEPGRGRGARRGDHAAGRARADRRDRAAADRVGRRDAAGRRRDQQLARRNRRRASRCSSRSR